MDFPSRLDLHDSGCVFDSIEKPILRLDGCQGDLRVAGHGALGLGTDCERQDDTVARKGIVGNGEGCDEVAFSP